MGPHLGRKAPVDVRRRLRREVGFGCPVSGCGNPYLEYHHFDPPWHQENHHNPAGMIALCATHHAKAGAWTDEDCRELKAHPHTAEVGGRFEWMRREVVAIVGGNYYHETPNMVVFRGQPIVWFERDTRERLLLSVRMLTTTGQPRLALLANDWMIEGTPIDFESPPNGSYLRARYENGDDMAIQFKEWESPEELAPKHPRILEALKEQIKFPLVTAEVEMIVGGTNLRFNAKESSLGGFTLSGFVASRCGVGFEFG